MTKRAHEEDDVIAASDRLSDRQSIFQAFFVPVRLTENAKTRATDTKTMVRPLVDSLRALPEVVEATHRVMAWRVARESPLGPVMSGGKLKVDEGYDDDGETGGGRACLKVLREQRIGQEAGHVGGVVMMARWYGGTMLGPIRFEHMQTVCERAILRSIIPAGQRRRTSPAAAVNQDEERTRLEKQLLARDRTVALLRDKVRGPESASSEPGEPASSSPGRQTDYGSASVEKLQRLLKARQSTIDLLRGKWAETTQESAEKDDF